DRRRRAEASYRMPAAHRGKDRGTRPSETPSPSSSRCPQRGRVGRACHFGLEPRRTPSGRLLAARVVGAVRRRRRSLLLCPSPHGWEGCALLACPRSPSAVSSRQFLSAAASSSTLSNNARATWNGSLTGSATTFSSGCPLRLRIWLHSRPGPSGNV